MEPQVHTFKNRTHTNSREVSTNRERLMITYQGSPVVSSPTCKVALLRRSRTKTYLIRLKTSLRGITVLKPSYILTQTCLWHHLMNYIRDKILYNKPVSLVRVNNRQRSNITLLEIPLWINCGLSNRWITWKLTKLTTSALTGFQTACLLLMMKSSILTCMTTRR